MSYDTSRFTGLWKKVKELFHPQYFSVMSTKAFRHYVSDRCAIPSNGFPVDVIFIVKNTLVRKQRVVDFIYASPKKTLGAWKWLLATRGIMIIKNGATPLYRLHYVMVFVSPPTFLECFEIGNVSACGWNLCHGVDGGQTQLNGHISFWCFYASPSGYAIEISEFRESNCGNACSCYALSSFPQCSRKEHPGKWNTLHER